MEQNKYPGKKEMQLKSIEFQKLREHAIKKGQFSLSGTEKTGFHCTENNETGSLFHYIHIYLNSKWSKDLNIKPKIIQLLRVIIRETLPSVRAGGGCWDLIPQGHTSKAEETTMQQKDMLCMLYT